MIGDWLQRFFDNPGADVGAVYNERALQLELAYALRRDGFQVEFERAFRVPRPGGSTLRPKHNLDLLVRRGDESVAIELKVPLNGQHPETMYAFCADIEFVEALKRAGIVDHGFCLMLTSDKVFWEDSGRGSPMHNAFRCRGTELTGAIGKPTGLRDSTVMVLGRYHLVDRWRTVAKGLLSSARLLLVEVQ